MSTNLTALAAKALHKTAQFALMYGASVEQCAKQLGVTADEFRKNLMGWQTDCRTTRLHSGLYKVVTRAGAFGYVQDDFGNLLPGNAAAALIG